MSTRRIPVKVLAEITLDEDEIAAAMEGDGDSTRTEKDAIFSLALEAFHPAENVDVKHLEILPIS